MDTPFLRLLPIRPQPLSGEAFLAPDAQTSRRRGSAIITVLILAAVTAVIAAGFLSRSAQEARLATRSFYNSVVLNLAEAGVEEGLFAVNTANLTTGNGWSLASGSSNDYVKSITSGLDFAQATGAIHVRVDNASSATPIVTAAGVVTIPKQPKIVKQLRIGGQASSRIWGNGIVAKGNVTFSGSADIDSYDSSVGPYNTATNRSDRATVATNATVQVTGSATIFGWVATGGAQPSVGGSGRIYGATSPASPRVDPSRVRTDFNTNLPDANAPAGTGIALGSVTSTLTLPRGSDVPGANGRYLYTASSFQLNGTAVLTIAGPVDIVSSSDATVNGSAKIVINNAADASFNLYCASTITLNGAGMVNNTGKAAKATIWGTKPSSGTQSVEINGSAAFVGTLYAPNANIQLNGASGFFGAVIGKTVTLAGSSDIHYDVQLAGAVSVGGPNPGSGSSSGTVRISSWAELRDAPGSGRAFARDSRAPFNTLF